MSTWLWAIWIYVGLAVLTLTPVVWVILRGVRPHVGGSFLDDAPNFSQVAKERLRHHYLRIAGTLAFWKQQATVYKRTHYYALFWAVTSSIIIPVLAQAVDPNDGASKWLLTVISTFAAVVFALHRSLKVDAHYQAFRLGESRYYDLARRLLDRPNSFGETEDVQLETFFSQVEELRAAVRMAETDAFPVVAAPEAVEAKQ